MARHGRLSLRAALGSFFTVLAFYVLAFCVWHGRRLWISTVRLDAVEPSYRHYDLIALRLRTRDPELLRRWRDSPPSARVLKDGRPVSTVAGISSVPLAWDPALGAFLGRWPCPWNAPDGEYLPSLQDEEGLGERVRPRPFRIERRRPKPLPRRFVALTLESVRPLATMRVRTPDGAVKDWRGLVDWAEYLKADAFWVLAGQTPGERRGETWLSYNLPLLPRLGAECRRRGIKFGVWAMCYLTMSENRLPRYEYALDVSEGRVVHTRAISLRDPRRPGDVIEFLGRFKGLPEVDYLGLDYIRNALGGYELADDFFAEMPGVVPPPGWGRLGREERMVWFARKKAMRTDPRFIDAWQWWRARRVALIVRRIKEALGEEKPLWAFTLTWQRGWHHGQDPVMMNDAGVDADALMLYEANAAQFEWMMQDWRSYVGRGDAQLVVGDVVDWPLHQRSPRGPGEFLYRMNRAADSIYKDGPAAGLFVHDLARALWGRLGPYSTSEWMQAARSAVLRFRSLPDHAPGPARPGPELPLRPAR